MNRIHRPRLAKPKPGNKREQCVLTSQLQNRPNCLSGLSGSVLKAAMSLQTEEPASVVYSLTSLPVAQNLYVYTG